VSSLVRLYLTFIIALLAGFSCKKAPDAIHPTVESITESVYASGVIKSEHQYQVFAAVTGIIQAVLVKEGDVVKKGDPLFLIQHETSRLQAENAQLAAEFAERNTAGARLAELRLAVDNALVKKSSDSVLVERQRDLWAQRIGAKIDLEQRELAYSNAVSAVEAARLRLRDAEQQLRFAAAQSKKQLAISQGTARDFVVRSQTDGKVFSIAKTVGEIVSAQNPLATIGSADVFIAELQIDEKDIIAVQPGQRVLLIMDSYKNQVFEARLTRINPIMNERTRTFTAEASFVQKPPILYPYLTTEANIILQTKPRVLTIPRACLVQDSLVVLANKDREKRRVSVGLKDYSKVEITGGITENDAILLNNN
jgi:HlyD family secretion protein